MTSRQATYLTCGVLGVLIVLPTGCGVELRDLNEFRFLAPLIIEKEEVSSAIIDTGGGYEILLRSTYDLPVVDEVDVITFLGPERVEVVGPFNYATGSIGAVADGAIVGISTCDCNGLGFEFFRKTGLVLELDFDARHAAFLHAVPIGGVNLPFADQPETLDGFDAAFLRVVVDVNGLKIPATALIDTGTTRTVIQRDFTENFIIQRAHAIELTVNQSQLGEVRLTARLFENESLPDIIIGLDVMSVWGGQWYFDFAGENGSFTIMPRSADNVNAKLQSPAIVRSRMVDGSEQQPTFGTAFRVR